MTKGNTTFTANFLSYPRKEVGELNALILAGGRDKSFSKDYAADAAFQINGQTMLDRVVQAIADTHHFKKIIVVGLREALSLENHALVTAFVEPRAAMADNLLAGLKTLGNEGSVLIAASDIPLLSCGTVDNFLKQCAAKPGADIYYPVIPREVFTEASPKIHRTFLRLRDGVFTGGNMVLARPRVIFDHFNIVRRIIDWRKKPLHWAKLFGVGYFLKGLCFGVSLSEIEGWISERFRIKGVAVRCSSLGVGLDADSEEDIDWIRFYWGGAEDPSSDLRSVISIVESLQSQINRGDLNKAKIKAILEAGKPLIVSVEKQRSE